jgi:CO/xanthine dehydrogenase Mo-binding subunit
MKYQDEVPGAGAGRVVMLDWNRREFVNLFGTGITVFFTFDPARLLATEPVRPPSAKGYPTDFNAYLHIGDDGRVTCFVGKVELGQGNRTSLAQLLAEDLEVPLDRVDMVMGDTDLCPWDMGTFGSLSIRMFGPVLRAAAAEAKAVLVQLAAERLGVPAVRLEVKAGVVIDTADRARQVTYAQLAAGKRIERHLDKPPAPKPATDFTVIGVAAQRKDGREKVTGRAQYAGDISFPDMLHARVLRPPAHGARLIEVNTSAVSSIEGARVVRDGDLIAVVHEHPDQAEEALGLVKARFDVPAATMDDTSIFDHLMKAAPAGDLVHESGSLEEGRAGAKQIIDRTYLNSYVAHATMETHTAVARMEGERMTVWASTQGPFIVRGQVAEALGVAPEKVRVITPYVGAGFGGKTSGPQAVEAARLAKIIGRPVQVVWDRADEFFHDTFRPAALVRIQSGLAASGKISFWDFEVFCAGDREAKQFYDVPHQRTVSHGGWHEAPPGLHPFGIGPWRAPSVNTNTFARESHIDAMAAAVAADPLEFRMRHLSDTRVRRVLSAASQRFDWTPVPAPSGRGVGVACAWYLGTCVATMAEVAVDRDRGLVQVKRVVCAQDMGVVVNPDGARQQMEGAITMGLGYALTEEVRFKGGEILDRNFDTYEVPRFSWLPKIETILIDAKDIPASGGGEPPIVCMGAVIANAIHDATGARLLQLPMTPARVKQALAQPAHPSTTPSGGR